jgi:two-component system chemotaxis response regulator CheB
MAKVYGPNAIAVLLTGMGDDGAAGLRAIFDAGGRTIAEDATTAVVYGMPGAAMALGAVEDSLPLPLIAPRLRQLALQPARAAS